MFQHGQQEHRPQQHLFRQINCYTDAWSIQLIASIIDDNRYQLISINQLRLIIDDQSMAKICEVIDWYQLSIPIDR